MVFFFCFRPYIAIIGDIKKSKAIADRRSVQVRLKDVLDNINEKYASVIAAKFIITLGDEFQGLLCEGKHVIDIVEEIQREMYPVEIRLGIGIGEITTDIDAEMAIGADGPGYYKAREAIEIIKDSEQKSKRQSSDLRIEIEDDEHLIAVMMNTIFSLMKAIKSNWTERQREIIYEYERQKGSQLECAKRLGISQSSVQRSLINGNYYVYKDAKETISNILREIGEVRV